MTAAAAQPLPVAPPVEPVPDPWQPANDVDEPLLPVQEMARKHRTVSYPRLTRAELRSGALAVYPDVERPRTRGDCQDGPRPCPFVSCAHHLYFDVDVSGAGTGALKFNFPELEPWQLRETCALDVADRGGVTLKEVGQLIGVTRERLRQIETQALNAARAAGIVS